MQANIGLIGLAVMGENLVLNMASKGFSVAVYNRTVERVDRFIEGRGAGKSCDLRNWELNWVRCRRTVAHFARRVKE